NSDTLSELYSSANKLGRIYGTPFTTIKIIMNRRTASVAAAASHTSIRTRKEKGCRFISNKLIFILTPPLQQRNAEIDNQNKYKQHHTGGNQRFSVKVGSITHF